MFGLRKKSDTRPLNYDTQIELLFPAALYDDPVIAPMLKQVGIEMEASGNKLMLFTDARTVAALNANQEIKNLMAKSGIGTVLYGWNSDERTSFLMKKLRAISDEHAGDHETRRLAVFELLMFVSNGLLGRLDPNPFASPLPVADPSDTFDLAAAMECMMSPEQLNKPKAPEHRRASLRFGTR